jgi:hypothetical protein
MPRNGQCLERPSRLKFLKRDGPPGATAAATVVVLDGPRRSGCAGNFHPDSLSHAKRLSPAGVGMPDLDCDFPTNRRGIRAFGRHRGISVSQSVQRGTHLCRGLDDGHGSKIRHHLHQFCLCDV